MINNFMLLPFPEKPLLMSYQDKAFPIGIIQANFDGDVLLWAALKSISCAFNINSKSHKFVYFFSDRYGCNEGITSKQFIDLNKDIYNFLNIDIVKFLRKQIENSCYIIGLYNEKYISSKSAYDRNDYDHDFLLYGYDEKGFYSAGYVSNGRFSLFHITNEELIDAILNTANNKIFFNFYSVSLNKKLSYNFEKYISDLKAYIDTYYDSIDDNMTSVYFGLAAMKRMKLYYINELTSDYPYIDERYTKALEEHKKMAHHVIAFLSNENPDFIDLKEKSYMVYKKAMLIHNLGIKFGMKKDVSIIQSIVNYMDEIINDEYEYMSRAYNLIHVHLESKRVG